MSLKDTMAAAQAALNECRWADDPIVRASHIAHYQTRIADGAVEEWSKIDGVEYIVVNRDGKRTLERVVE